MPFIMVVNNMASPMPLGGTALSVGQIEFVRRWIEAGAPKTGEVADAKLLDDTTPSVSVTDDFNANEFTQRQKAWMAIN